MSALVAKQHGSATEMVGAILTLDQVREVIARYRAANARARRESPASEQVALIAADVGAGDILMLLEERAETP